MFKKYLSGAALFASLVPIVSYAQQTSVDTLAKRVVVSATRVEQNSFDIPASVDSIDRQAIQDGQLLVNLSESLARVPGIVAQNRQNYAQDLQISARGFGARSTFGVRGLRLYSDGIPATMPDGQGQLSHFDLGSAERIEVLRGPFSALYGNSSGGVISVFTEQGKPGAALVPSAAFGSFATQRLGLKASGERGTLNYLLNVSTFTTDGYRDHSKTKRDTFNAKLGLRLDDDSKLTLVANAVDMPRAQDPLGLNRAQYQANPRQVDAGALTFDTRKTVAQHQAGFGYERRLSTADILNVTLYFGRRDTTQFQAIPTGNPGPTPAKSGQYLATSPGGVIDLGRDYWGLDLRWTHRGALGGLPLRVTAGIDYDKLDEARKGFQNFIGSQLGVMGALRRDENNRIFNFDQFTQAQLDLSERWMLHAGVRNTSIKVRSQDNYVVTGNADDSGNTRFATSTPAIGAIFRAGDALNLYASYGKGFETPTMNELSYRSSGSGLNFDLKAAKSDHLELGAKAILANAMQLNAALFHIDTRNEIVVLTNTGGRSVFQNVGGTRRDGVELSLDARLGRGFGLVGAYTWLKAEYADNFLTCNAAPCTTPNLPIAAGNAMPGIPRTMLYTELSWKHLSSGFASAVEIRRVGQVYVDDANSDAAAAYTVANLKLGFEQSAGRWRVKEFLRIDNFTDRKYAGSVIVNEGNRRYFEPAPGRSWLVGINGQFEF